MDSAVYHIDQQELAQRLKTIRNNKKMTQSKAASSLDMARTTLVAIEKGDRAVTQRELLKFADLYEVSVNRLIRPSALHVSFKVDFRKAVDSEISKAVQDTTDLLQHLATGYAELESLLGQSSKQAYPPVQPVLAGNLDQQAEDLALHVRGLLGLGLGPIEDLIGVLEHAWGFRIFLYPLHSRISGVFGFAEEVGPCVLLNVKHPRSRCIWSLAHELGHFLTTRDETNVVLESDRLGLTSDQFVDRFAAALLLPGMAMRREFKEQGRFTARHLIYFAHRYHVSLEAYTRRLEHLKLLPRGTYEKLRDRGLGKQQVEEVLGSPFERAWARTPRFTLTVFNAYDSGYLSEGQVAEMLAVGRQEIRENLDIFGGGDVELS